MNTNLQCQNPCHPSGAPKEMVCVKEDPEYFVFACKACMEINRVQSIQVKTRTWVKQEARRGLEARGQLLKSLPPKIRKVVMDESLRKERIN